MNLQHNFTKTGLEVFELALLQSLLFCLMLYYYYQYFENFLKNKGPIYV